MILFFDKDLVQVFWPITFLLQFILLEKNPIEIHVKNTFVKSIDKA